MQFKTFNKRIIKQPKEYIIPRRIRGKQNLNMFKTEWEEAQTFLIPPPYVFTYSNLTCKKYPKKNNLKQIHNQQSHLDKKTANAINQIILKK